MIVRPEQLPAIKESAYFLESKLRFGPFKLLNKKRDIHDFYAKVVFNTNWEELSRVSKGHDNSDSHFSELLATKHQIVDRLESNIKALPDENSIAWMFIDRSERVVDETLKQLIRSEPHFDSFELSHDNNAAPLINQLWDAYREVPRNYLFSELLSHFTDTLGPLDWEFNELLMATFFSEPSFESVICSYKSWLRFNNNGIDFTLPDELSLIDIYLITQLVDNQVKGCTQLLNQLPMAAAQQVIVNSLHFGDLAIANVIIDFNDPGAGEDANRAANIQFKKLLEPFPELEATSPFYRAFSDLKKALSEPKNYQPAQKERGGYAPQPTVYQGLLFRSRLEAKYAYFFDKLGLEWRYETEFFSTRHGYYLPDFYLPALNAWVEVKGTLPTQTEIDKLADVVKETGRPGLVLSGTLPGAVTLITTGSREAAYFFPSEWKHLAKSSPEAYQLLHTTAKQIESEHYLFDSTHIADFCQQATVECNETYRRLYNRYAKGSLFGRFSEGRREGSVYQNQIKHSRLDEEELMTLAKAWGEISSL